VSSSGLTESSHEFDSSAPDELHASPFLEGPRTTQLLSGNQELLAHLAEIRTLRLQCGQEDDLTTDPEYFIAANTLGNRKCSAVLIRRDQELEACVLFYEHTRRGLGLGLFRGGDYIGESLVAGPSAFQVHYVHLATQALLKKWRIHGVSLSIKAPETTCIEVMGTPNEFRRFLCTQIQHKLSLESTYEGMLASMGPRTRRSLNGKRQQLEKSANVQFIPSLDPDEALAIMLGLESKSNPRHIGEFFQARHRLLCSNPDFFSMGLRLPDGPWLSLLTGWRRNQVTYVDLQMNDMHYKKESLSAVMRAFFLEHEIGNKQQLVNFVGGSSLLLRRYCAPVEPCTEVFVYKSNILSRFFEWIGRHAQSGSVYERLKPGMTRRVDAGADGQSSSEIEN
jgi:hypothetical protein